MPEAVATRLLAAGIVPFKRYVYEAVFEALGPGL
jgi:hypothetical protein